MTTLLYFPINFQHFSKQKTTFSISLQKNFCTLVMSELNFLLLCRKFTIILTRQEIKLHDKLATNLVGDDFSVATLTFDCKNYFLFLY